jgi:hypothetical protein
LQLHCQFQIHSGSGRLAIRIRDILHPACGAYAGGWWISREITLAGTQARILVFWWFTV